MRDATGQLIIDERPAMQDEVDGAPAQSAFRHMAERLTMIRARGAYGRRASRKTISEVSGATGLPVSVHHYDESTGQTVIQTVQNVNPIADVAKEFRQQGLDGYTENRDMKHVALLPPAVVGNLYRQGINVLNDNDWPKVAALLDGPDMQIWRTGQGKISRRAYREHPTTRGGRSARS